MFTEDEIEHPELLMEDTPSPYMEYNDDTFSPTSPIDGKSVHSLTSFLIYTTQSCPNVILM